MKRIGVIAEDKSDVEVLDEILRKYGITFRLLDFVGNGCGRIHAKCKRWSANLQQRGCTRIILIHDSDGKDANKLHDSLSVSLDASAEAPHVIVIPVQEVEAWLLSDERAVTRALRLKNAVKRLPNPETIGSPKERLAKEIWQKSSRRITYLNTKHNRLIAHEAELAKLRRCPSFLPLDEFINQHL